MSDPKADLVAQVRERSVPIGSTAQQWRRDAIRLADEVERLRENIDGLDAMEAEVRRLREVLEKLARLGNEPEYGNSRGNKIARAAVEGTGGNQWQRRKS